MLTSPRYPANFDDGALMTTEDSHSKLIDKVFDSIVAKHGEFISVKLLTVPEQTVLSVVTSKGYIDNGGFSFLFEMNIPGDPTYQLTLAGYRRIGATRAASAIEKALNLFPCSPSTDREERVHAYLAYPQG